MLTAMNTHSPQVSTVPNRLGMDSIRCEMGGYKILNHAMAAKPQKKQYSRLMRPPRLNGIAL